MSERIAPTTVTVGVVFEADGEPDDPDTVTVAYGPKGGTPVASFTFGDDADVSHPETGAYQITVTGDDAGEWVARFTGQWGTGPAAVVRTIERHWWIAPSALMLDSE